jgi:hypothetical protein
MNREGEVVVDIGSQGVLGFMGFAPPSRGDILYTVDSPIVFGFLIHGLLMI